ncbi:MAG TPA: endonuclease/exonuclease/phosphatase family protein [Anaerolineales bacterium]|nr:endonuclease/exonuclease/phosphatase family protein [Anaerolineales bacterium]
MLQRPRIHTLWKFLLPVAILSLLVAFLLNASEPGGAVEGCPLECAVQARRQPGPLRVLSLNMLHGHPDFEHLPLRLDLIAAEIQRLDADVVLLQETPWTRTTGNGARYLAQQLGYNYLYYRANGNRRLIFFEEGEAILSRFPLNNPLFTILQPRPGFFESRVALGASAATPWGEVVFYVTHLTDKDPQVGRRQVESLRDFVEAHTGSLKVVAGDFNAQEDSPQIVDLMTNWTDAYQAIHPGEEGLTCCIDDLVAGPEEPLEKRIDYIFLVAEKGESGKIISARIAFDQPFPVSSGWQWASDHTGLLVEIELQSGD